MDDLALFLLTAKAWVPCHSGSSDWEFCAIAVLLLVKVGSTVMLLASSDLRLCRSTALRRLPNPSLGIWTRKGRLGFDDAEGLSVKVSASVARSSESSDGRESG